MNNISAFKNCFNAGDLLAAIPVMKESYIQTGKKVVIYCWLNKQMTYPDPSWKHPIIHDGEQVSMNERMFNFLRPLFLEQPFVEDMLVWKGEPIDYDLDKLKESFLIMPYGSLNRWLFYILPEFSCDISKRWLECTVKYDERINNKICITRTCRWRNHLINYFFLKEYRDELLFLGLPEEAQEFASEWGFDIDCYIGDNAADISSVLYQSRFFISNQTMTYQIAEGMKIRRILERFPPLPHVIPEGADGYDFADQKGLETLFHKLYNETKQKV